MKRLFLALLFLGAAICTTSAETKLSRTKATNMHPKEWMRDPYIYLHTDGKYYMTFTMGQDKLPIWMSDDLVNWERGFSDYDVTKLPNFAEKSAKAVDKGGYKLWAPKLYFLDGKWCVVHTSNVQASEIITTDDLSFANFKIPFVENFGHHHDPTITVDSDGSRWLVSRCAEIQKIKGDMSNFDGKPININPADRKMGHEGCQIIKVGGKYIWFGTAWSEDKLRHGTYNLYYATADRIEGPYSERKLAGYCLGHGTMFMDKDGQWWCTAFRNGEEKPSDGRQALTINKSGLTLVPMTLEVKRGEVKVVPNDPAYRVVN